jgi:hypothetical protein
VSRRTLEKQYLPGLWRWVYFQCFRLGAERIEDAVEICPFDLACLCRVFQAQQTKRMTAIHLGSSDENCQNVFEGLDVVEQDQTAGLEYQNWLGMTSPRTTPVCRQDHEPYLLAEILIAVSAKER